MNTGPASRRFKLLVLHYNNYGILTETITMIRFCKGHDQLRSAQESILYVGCIYDWRKITRCKMQHWTLESGSENSTGLYFVRRHERGPEEVRTGSVTTQLVHGSIVKWRHAPGKNIIKLSCSTATGAGLAFSDQRSCWDHIICKTERESLWEKTLSKIWYQTEVTCIRNLFNHIYSAKNILIFYFSSLSGPFYKLSGLKHHYAIFTRSHIPYWLPFKSISSETWFWKSPQLNKSLFVHRHNILEEDTEHKQALQQSETYIVLVVMSQHPGFLNIN